MRNYEKITRIRAEDGIKFNKCAVCLIHFPLATLSPVAVFKDAGLALVPFEQPAYVLLVGQQYQQSHRYGKDTV
jgi:hypothetical protein